MKRAKQIHMLLRVMWGHRPAFRLKLERLVEMKKIGAWALSNQATPDHKAQMVGCRVPGSAAVYSRGEHY